MVLFRLVVFLLLIELHHVFSQTNGEFVKPSTHTDHQDVRNEKSDSNGRLMNLESEVEKNSNKLDDLMRHNRQQFEQLMKQISSVSDAQRLSIRYVLAPKCAEFILNDDFDNARTILNVFRVDDYDEVIRETFKNTSESFWKILHFADTLQDDVKIISVYSKLFKRSEYIAFKDLQFEIRVLDHIEQRYNSSEWISLQEIISDSSLLKLSEAILNKLCVNITKNEVDDQYSNSNILIQIISSVGQAILKAVIYQCIILSMDFVERRGNLPLRIEVLLTIFDKLAVKECLDFPMWFRVGTAVKSMYNSKMLNSQIKTQLDALKERMPKSIKAAVFAERICIRNKGSNKYLKASNENEKGEWRILFSSEEKVSSSIQWTINDYDKVMVKLQNQLNKQFLIKNSRGESMFRQNVYGFNFSTNTNSTVYSLHQADDNCFIDADDEYLRDYNGTLFCSSVKDEFSKWVIEAC